MSDDYPKVMTRAGAEISVGGAAEETEKRADGWCSPLDAPSEPETAKPPVETDGVAGEPPDAPGDPFDHEPTFGASGDASHTPLKRGGKKK